jgi:hypothetical protein
VKRVLDLSASRVYCADIGSVSAGNFGWARDCGPGGVAEVRRGGEEIVDLSLAVATDLRNGLPIALGFECPLWVPIPADHLELGHKRPGEGDRPWSAGAGAAVLVTGLAQVTWILREITKLASGMPRFFLSWQEFRAAGSGIFLWEAFVTKDAKAGSHADDAAAAVSYFVAALPDPTVLDLGAETEVYSLLGAALLRVGWSDDPGLLGRPCLVLRAVKAKDRS